MHTLFSALLCNSIFQIAPLMHIQIHLTPIISDREPHIDYLSTIHMTYQWFINGCVLSTVISCINTHAYVNTHTHTHAYTHPHTHPHTRIHKHTHGCDIYIYRYIYIYTGVYWCITV